MELTHGNPVLRDAVFDAIVQRKGWSTPTEIATYLKHDHDPNGPLKRLFDFEVLERRRRDGSREFEYTLGPRADRYEEVRGKRFSDKTFKTRSQRRAMNHIPAPVPADASADASLGLVIRIGGQAHAITLNDARAIWVQLGTLFGKR